MKCFKHVAGKTHTHASTGTMMEVWLKLQLHVVVWYDDSASAHIECCVLFDDE